jgi:hypothetical protein
MRTSEKPDLRKFVDEVLIIRILGTSPFGDSRKFGCRIVACCVLHENSVEKWEANWHEAEEVKATS